MKIAISMSVFIVAIIAVVLLVKTNTPADKATGVSSEENLKKVELASGLPELFTQDADLASDDASLVTLFEDAAEAERYVTGGVDSDTRVEKSIPVCEALIAAVHSGGFTSGAFDDMLSNDHNKFRDLLLTITEAANAVVDRCIEDGEIEQADRIARARFELGRRMYAGSLMLKARELGLDVMRKGLSQISMVARASEEEGLSDEAERNAVNAQAQAWQDAIAALIQAWSPKLDVIRRAKPNPADMIRIAELDEDRSFRIYATRLLGYAKLERGEPGNQRIINEAIERAKGSDDPLVAAAGEAAAAMTPETFHSTPR